MSVVPGMCAPCVTQFSAFYLNARDFYCIVYLYLEHSVKAKTLSQGRNVNVGISRRAYFNHGCCILDLQHPGWDSRGCVSCKNEGF